MKGNPPEGSGEPVYSCREETRLLGWFKMLTAVEQEAKIEKQHNSIGTRGDPIKVVQHDCQMVELNHRGLLL